MYAMLLKIYPNPTTYIFGKINFPRQCAAAQCSCVYTKHCFFFVSLVHIHLRCAAFNILYLLCVYVCVTYVCIYTCEASILDCIQKKN